MSGAGGLDLVVIVAAIAIGAFVKGATGGGLPQIAIPVMAAFLGVERSVVVMAIPGVVANGWLVWSHRAEASETRDLPVMMACGAVGSVIGTLALKGLDAQVLSAVLAAIIVGYVVLSLTRPGFHLPPRVTRIASPPVGVAAGGLQGATGISGPLLSTYLHGFGLRPRAYVFALATLFFGFALVQTVALFGVGLYTESRLLESLLALVPIAVALPLGSWAARKVSVTTFNRAVLALLLASAAALVHEAVTGLMPDPQLDPKVDAVVANWYPRFLANGIDWFDLQRTLDQVTDWSSWAPAWTAVADGYERLGREALATGHRVTAAEHLRRSALTLQFAQFVLTDEPDRRRRLQERMVATYGAAAPLLDPPARRVEIPYGADGHHVVGYLRLPAGRDVPPGVAVLVPGLESTKEQFSTYEPYFLRRGVATLSVEGPGQGEAGWATVFREATYAEAMAAVATAVRGGRHRIDGVDPGRVVVVGTSFGGYLALRHATAFARHDQLRGVVDIAGPYDLRAFDELQPVTRDGFRDLVGATTEAAARELLADVSLDGAADGLTAPVLVVHGQQDRIIDVSHAHRVVAALDGRATVRLEPTGNHSCNNLAATVRPAVADWTSDRLDGLEVQQ